MEPFVGTVFEDYMAQELELIESKEAIQIGLDADLDVLYIMIPDFMSEKAIKMISYAILELFNTFPNQKVSAKDERHKEEEDVSVYHLMDWVPEGKQHDACASRQILANGKVFAVESIIRLSTALKVFRQVTSAYFENIDNSMWKTYRDVAGRCTEAYGRLMKSSLDDAFLGLAINNGRVKNHRDWNDIQGGLSVLASYGCFEGGELCLPQIGVKFLYKPGEVIFISSQAVEHFIAPYTGFRIGTVHCSHNSRRVLAEKARALESELDMLAKTDVGLLFERLNELCEEEEEYRKELARKRETNAKKAEAKKRANENNHTPKKK
ncbi:hypothetical protein AKO1_001372, partial [Acrasis kona]